MPVPTSTTLCHLLPDQIESIAVILSVSTGLQSYIDQTMLNSASFNYISISATVSQIPDIGSQGGAGGDAEGLEEYPENTTGIYPYEVEKLEQKIGRPHV